MLPVVLDGLYYFVADDDIHGDELWVSDGTASGTQMVGDLYPGGFGSDIVEIIPFKGDIYANAWIDGNEFELVKIDVSEGAAEIVKDIYPGDSGYPQFLYVFGDLLLFLAEDGGHGYELWKSDGTTSGTKLIKDIYPGTSQGAQFFLGRMAVDDIFYFSADDGVNGIELWKTDGTEVGTKMVSDLYPGSNGSEPYRFGEFKDRLYFSADDGSGYKPWYTFISKKIHPQAYFWNPVALLRNQKMTMMGKKKFRTTNDS